MPAPSPSRRLPPPAARLRDPRRKDAGLVVVSIAGVGTAYVAAAETLPFAIATVVGVSTAAGMYARLAMGRWRAAAQILATAVLLALLAAPPRLVGVLLVTGLAAGELIARRARRSDVLPVSAWVAGIACATSASGVAAAVSLPARAALNEGLAALAGGFLSTPLMLTLAPVAERVFGHITRLTMSDWLSYEHPLLRQLAATAPGTFQHSVNVGLLADAAATAIGADALLARVGALYHDVGKMNAPEYFIENQRGPNPHDQLDPSESARILRAHVTDGVDLVNRHRMGERIADFVREHHGSGEMRSLREKAGAQAGSGDSDTYRYPGPPPQSREAGILMIADQLEATARSQPPADEAACQAIVERTIARIRGERQLEGARLSSGDLARAGEAFSRALQAMYHRRVSYPSAGGGDGPRPRLIFRRRPRRVAS